MSLLSSCLGVGRDLLVLSCLSLRCLGLLVTSRWVLTQSLCACPFLVEVSFGMKWKQKMLPSKSKYCLCVNLCVDVYPRQSFQESQIKKIKSAWVAIFRWNVEWNGKSQPKTHAPYPFLSHTGQNYTLVPE